MDSSDQPLKNLGKAIIVYLGSAWLFLEMTNFLVDRFQLDSVLIDTLLWIIIFGLPAFTIYIYFGHRFPWKAIVLHAINLTLATTVIGYHLLNPERLDPTHLRLLQFKNDQTELASSIRSIAILSIDNYTGNNSNDFLSAGIHDALISELGKVSAIRVISRTSTLPYVDSNKSVQEIARELKVDAIIEGSLLAADEIVRVQMKLISAFPEEMQLWSDTYDTPMIDILQVYSKMTKVIAKEINITLTPGEQRLLATNRKVNPEAYEAYLKGKYSMGMLSQESIQAAMGHFQRAIEIDPDFAPAYGGLGGIWAFLKQMDLVTSEQAESPIKSNLQKAKELDSTLAEVYYWEAVTSVWTDYNWEKGMAQFRKSIEINPNHSEARALFAHLNWILLDHKQAREQFKEALEIDPENPFIKVLHSAYFGLGSVDPDSAIAILTPLQKMMPTNPLVNLVMLASYHQKGNDDQAFEQLKIKIHLETDTSLYDWMNDTYMKVGLKGVARETAQFLEQHYYRSLSAQTFQVLYHIAGAEEKSLDWLEKGYIRRDADMPYIKAVYYARYYRSHPRYQEILNKMNL